MDMDDYLEAPIVPWDGDELDTFIAQELVPHAEPTHTDVDDLLRAASRVLLRELLAAEALEIITAENSNPYFDISINIGETELGFWDMYECGYRPIWDWWPEFSRVIAEEFEDAEKNDDLIEYTLAVGTWSDAMDYGRTATTAAHAVMAAAQLRRTSGEFGAADAILCMLAAHPATPAGVLALLETDEDETVSATATDASQGSEQS